MPVPFAPPTRVLLPLAFAGAAAVGALAAVRGPDAAWGAALGLAIVAAFFLGGQVPVLLSRQVPAGVSFVLLGLGYVLRLLLLLVVLRSVRGATWLDTDVLGVTVILASLVWIAAQTWTYLTRNPLPDRAVPTSPSDRRATGAAGS